MASRAKPDTKSAVAYLRVSTDEQCLGPEAQRAAVEAWAAREGVEVVAWHVDAGVSGAAPLDRRPALLAALDSLREHRAGVLVVAKRDRLARDVVLAAMVERLAERQGARVLGADGAGNGEGPEAGLMRNLLSAFAEYERALIRARTRAALRVKRARGERAGAVPFGFRADPSGRLSPEPAEQAVAERVRALSATGLSTRAVVAALAVEGVASPRSGRALNQTQVARILARFVPAVAA